MSAAPRLDPTLEREARARALIATVMREGRPFEAECPLVFGGLLEGEPPGRVVSLAEGGQVLSACAMLARDAVTPGGVHRVGLIGWVVTDPAARGRGLASKVLEAAERELASDGCELALLWADDPEFYRRRGYTEIGAELDVELEPAALDRFPSWPTVRPLDPARDAQPTLELLAAMPAHLRRTPAEHSALLGVPGMRAEVALGDDGRVVAYACEGRGEDLVGVIHEWAGDPRAVLALQARAARRVHARGQRAFAIGPGPTHAVCAAWFELGLAPVPGLLGMAKPLSPDLPDAAQWCPPRRFEAEAPGVGLFCWGLDSI